MCVIPGGPYEMAFWILLIDSSVPYSEKKLLKSSLNAKWAASTNNKLFTGKNMYKFDEQLGKAAF